MIQNNVIVIKISYIDKICINIKYKIEQMVYKNKCQIHLIIGLDKKFNYIFLRDINANFY